MLLTTINSGGFGLGALNEADEDDLDVYDSLQHPPSSRRRDAYDHIEGVDDDDTVFIRSGSGTSKADAGKRKGTSLHVCGMTLTLAMFNLSRLWAEGGHT